MSWDPFDEEPEEPAHFDVAQVCLNGHVVTPASQRSPERQQRRCVKCGEATITACPECKAEIRGYYYVPGVIDLTGGYSLPSFCHDCGKAYPWTSRRLEAAKAYAQELNALTPEERVQLAVSLDELVKDTPMAQVAAGRFKRLAAKAGKEASGFFRDILVDVFSETVKKAIWGPGA